MIKSDAEKQGGNGVAVRETILTLTDTMAIPVPSTPSYSPC